LYLSDLAYVDSETQIRDGLATVNNDGWQLLYVDTKGNPKEPAHFLAVEKQAAPLKKSKSNDKTTSGDDTAKEETTIWQKVTGRNLADLLSPQDSVKVMIVVRGTKPWPMFCQMGCWKLRRSKPNTKPMEAFNKVDTTLWKNTLVA